MRRILSVFILVLTFQAGAATPPPAQLLPHDTLALFSVPDWDQVVSYWNNSPYRKLWNDPALKSFRDRIEQRWNDEYAAPLERHLGIKLSDYTPLLHGQLTFAVVQGGWGTRPGGQSSLVLILDTKDKQAELKARLAELRKKLGDSGKPLRTDRIRDVEFTTLILSNEELKKALEKAFPPPADELEEDPAAQDSPSAKGAGKTEISFGQSGSLLIAGTNVKDLETVLARQAGGFAPALADQASFEPSHVALFRDALAVGWVNFGSIYGTLSKRWDQSSRTAQAGTPFGLRLDKATAAAGFGGLKSVAARFGGGVEGASAEVFLSIPESQRQGIFRLLSLEKKEAGPPPFVGADVVKFQRWRIDGQRAWSTIESMLTSISPDLSNLIQTTLRAVGKDRDPNFDFKKTLIGNLGNDFIFFQKPPKSSSLADLNALPSLLLVGSPNPENLVQGLKAGTGLMPLSGGEPELKERDFLGRKIYSLSLAGPDGLDGPADPSASRQLNFAASASYAAVSADVAAIEEFLRSTESAGRALRDTPGLADAAQKVGGMSTGLFGFQNQAEAIRIWLESALKESAALDKLLSLAPLAGGKVMSPEERRKMQEWLDASALPAFESIRKYFHFVVFSLNSSDAGLSWKLFAPTPPQTK